MASQDVFEADLARFNAFFQEAGAVLTFEDGSRGVDPTKVPESVLSAHQGLLSYGYANGLL